MRLDLYLFENGYAKSRTEAKNLITDGAVKVFGTVVTKPSFDVDSDSKIEIIKETSKYVSRGGYKLEGALKAFDVSVSDRLCIDVGASSGGFTDCLLQNGAKHVIAVDSGSGQIADFLRNSDSVTVLENFNARYMKPSDFEFTPSLAVMDVSFISATYIIPAVYDVLSDNSDFICLIKPQFEVGKASLGKGGIVKDKKALDFAKSKVSDFAKEIGFKHIKTIESPIKGGDGNTEYLAYFRKEMKNE